MIKNSLVIYDSGLGGIAILKELLKLNPNFNLTYIADNQFFPLGQKSFIEIQERCKAVSNYFFKKDANLLILGCNTATVSSIRELQARWLPLNFPDKNILGVSTPLTEMMREYSWDLRDELGLILSTEATFKTGFYQSEFLKYGFRNFVPCPAPQLATAIESNDKDFIEKTIKDAFRNINKEEVSMVILACTHYHFASNEIKKFFNNKVKIIDPTFETAKKIIEYTKRHPEFTLSNKTREPIIYYTNKQKPPVFETIILDFSLEYLNL